MSVSGALSTAMSGLTAARRASEVVAGNIANAMTEGYARREISLTADTSSSTGGVRVNGVVRVSDPRTLHDRRMADAGLAHADARAAFQTNLSDRLGMPGDGSNLSDRVAALDAALIDAASRPDSVVRLDQVVRAAEGVTDVLNSLSQSVQADRAEADRTIGDMVAQLNTDLDRIVGINSQITRASSGGLDTSALIDQRQQLIDAVNEIVPVHEIPRGNGQVALYSTSGAILIDGPAAKLEFTPASSVAAHSSVENGLLSGIAINGQTVRAAGPGGVLDGGALGAQFLVRDDLSVTAQAELDTVAQDLVGRFTSLAHDGATDALGAGLFVGPDASMPGAALDIAVNPAVLAEGSWRLRDGLDASAPGAVGDTSLLTAFRDALKAPSLLDGSSLSAFGMAEQIESRFASEAVNLDADRSFAAAQQSHLREIEAQQGVDTDAELQRLLLVEQAYAANARVIQAADDMMQQLLNL